MLGSSAVMLRTRRLSSPVATIWRELESRERRASAALSPARSQGLSQNITSPQLRLSSNGITTTYPLDSYVAHFARSGRTFRIRRALSTRLLGLLPNAVEPRRFILPKASVLLDLKQNQSLACCFSSHLPSLLFPSSRSPVAGRQQRPSCSSCSLLSPTSHRRPLGLPSTIGFRSLRIPPPFVSLSQLSPACALLPLYHSH